MSSKVLNPIHELALIALGRKYAGLLGFPKLGHILADDYEVYRSREDHEILKNIPKYVTEE